MTESMVLQLLRDTGAENASQISKASYLLSRIGRSDLDLLADAELDFELDVLATSLEGVAADTEDQVDQSLLYENAFLCRRKETPAQPVEKLRHLVLLAADGILASRRPEVMLSLRDSGIPARNELLTSASPLDEQLERDVLRAFLLLARRGEGWADLDASRDAISNLRNYHQEGQESFLSRYDDKTEAGVRLIARFNLAKIVEIASSYTVNGQPTDAEIQIDRHERNLRDLFKIRPDLPFEELCQAVVAACRAIVSSSIWKNTRLLGQDFRAFVSALASHQKNPTLELWPSQRTALDQHLLDPARRAVVVEMPTSAGKTLLAEFSIVQAHALNRSSTVAYLVPTRALVNQITQRLRRDFKPLNLVVEAAAPVFELDPTEDQLLQQHIDVLVCTPEKLDLLIKSRHDAVRNLSLAVVDEAHNLADGDRGVRMELLLGTLKRERPETRFLMLTPFVPNASELGRWLGDGADATISVNWRPSERVVTCTEWKKIRKGPHVLSLTTLESADNVDVPAGHTVELLRVSGDVKRTKSQTSAYAAVELAEKGSVLVLVRGRKPAEDRAAAVAALRPPRRLSQFGEAVRNYVSLEYGETHPLVGYVERGVTYHHAGLSHDLRFLLEGLIEKGDVDIVCGTTTLAQGLNFPISSVILETMSKYQGIGNGTKPLSYAEFWNIAGRAGRALQDSLGLVVFPTLSNEDREEVQGFLRRQAVDICSHLMQATNDLSSVVERFDLSFVRQNSALAVFLQYLAHAARVAGAEESGRDIEELLRSSLVYHQTQESDRRLADQLISIARKFMSELEEYDRGYLALADGTGFSLPSVNYAFARTAEYPEFRREGFWDAQNLFGPNIDDLTRVIEVLADIPELALGVSDESAAPFNARTVAGVTRDWVNGESLRTIADKWFRHEPGGPMERLRAAGLYVHSRLVGQVPWGMGALQKLTSSSAEPEGSNAYAAAMVFYGVPSAGAVAMRMGGVPRAAAHQLGTEWLSAGRTGTTFRDLRQWIASRTDQEWASALPSRSRLTGEQCRTLWYELAGYRE
ncbi:DEAD/DEAH box helicase [Streptomyces sp. NPDC004596]